MVYISGKKLAREMASALWAKTFVETEIAGDGRLTLPLCGCPWSVEYTSEKASLHIR